MAEAVVSDLPEATSYVKATAAAQLITDDEYLWATACPGHFNLAHQWVGDTQNICTITDTGPTPWLAKPLGGHS